MQLKKNSKQEPEPQTRWLSVDAGISGTLTFKDAVNLQINGKFEGTLDTRGNLSIGEKAIVKATIQGESISVGGAVEGSISASNRVELLGTARVNGKITTPRLAIQDGAFFQGTVDMSGVPTNGVASWMNTVELANFLEVDEGTVVKWAQEGRLPSQRQGDQWRFERSRIDDWLAQEKIR